MSDSLPMPTAEDYAEIVDFLREVQNQLDEPVDVPDQAIRRFLESVDEAERQRIIDPHASVDGYLRHLERAAAEPAGPADSA